MCIHCYGVPRCFKNGIRKAAAKYKETVLRCGNTSCQSEFLVINSMRGLIEDVQHEIWRSLPCNWHHSMTAEEMNEGYSIGKENLLPRLPTFALTTQSATLVDSSSHHTTGIMSAPVSFSAA